MPDVFISYAREDRDLAKRLAEAIELRGWKVWWDRRIPAGKSYEDVIQQAIDDAACVVVLWTRISIASEWVRNEAAEGVRRKVLIPIRLEDVRLPLAFRHLQSDDLFGWTSVEIENCLGSIESMIGPPAPRERQPRIADPVRVEIPPAVPPPDNKTPAAAALPISPPPASSSSPVNPLGALVGVLLGAVLVILIALSLKPSENPATDTAVTDTSMTTGDTAGTSTTSTDTTMTTADPIAAIMNDTMPAREPVSVFPTSTSSTSTGATTSDVAVTAEVVDFQTPAGTFTIEFFPKAAPNHVRSLLAAIRSGGFDGTPINLINDDGICVCPSSPEMSFESNNIAFVRGTVMDVGNTKGQDRSAEFFINSRPINYDQKFSAVFGRVIAGMDVIDSIGRLPIDKDHSPLKPFNIQRATIRKRDARGL